MRSQVSRLLQCNLERPLGLQDLAQQTVRPLGWTEVLRLLWMRFRLLVL